MEYKISYLYKQLIIYYVQMVAIIMAGITNYENNIYIYIFLEVIIVRNKIISFFFFFFLYY